MKHKKMEFWVTNISSTNVSLSDLALLIKLKSVFERFGVSIN
jgi:hypothetical protein